MKWMKNEVVIKAQLVEKIFQIGVLAQLVKYRSF